VKVTKKKNAFKQTFFLLVICPFDKDKNQFFEAKKRFFASK